MDIEQLKLVIETVKSVSGDAQTVAITWLLLDKLLPVIAWLIAGFGAFKLTARLLLNFNSHKDMCDIRDMLGIGVPGHLMDCERNKILAKIRELAKK
jgi:hypothetical protein